MYLLRGFAVWLILMAVESVHGTLRELFLAPLVGNFRARQIAVCTGSLLILGAACLFVRWMRAGTTRKLITVGLLLCAEREVPARLLIIPAAWSLLGSTAPKLLGVTEDYGLVVAAVLSTSLIAFRNRNLRVGLARRAAQKDVYFGRAPTE